MFNLDKFLKPVLWLGLAVMLCVPLFMNSNYFFPFIYSKVIVFRIGLELLLIVLLGLIAWGKSLKLTFDWIIIVFAAYLAVMFLSSLLGDNFYLSFWSYIERSEGLLLWIHLFLFLFIFRNALTSQKQWLVFFDIFFAVTQIVAIIGLLQYWQVDFINASNTGDARVSSTIGNAAFLAGYLLYAVFIGLYLAIKRGGWLWSYYGVMIFIDVFVLFQTGTRGAFLGLLASTALFAIYNVLWGKSKQVRNLSIICGVVLLAFLSIVFANKQASWVQSNVGLARLVSISASDPTAQARLQTWGSAWQGFVRKPILGYGQENFAEVFNQYFNPLIYRHANSRVWYDRAHDIFIDHLITGGVIGLALYMAMLIIPLIWLVRSQIRKRKELGRIDTSQLAEQMLILSFVGFLVQGTFVFESLVTYIPMFLILAYLGWKYQPKAFVVTNKTVQRIIFVLFVMATVPAMYFFNVRETQANLLTIQGLAVQQYDEKEAIANYERAIDLGTSGTQEYRRRLAEFVSGLIVGKAITPAEASIYVKRIDQELEARLQEVPNDVANMLLYMRFLNTTYVLDPTRLLKVDDLGQKALKYSPTRPQLYYEMGYTQFYLSQWYKDQGKTEDRQKALTKMKDYFQKSIDLNPNVKESYINMIMVLLATDQPQEVAPYMAEMDKRQLDYFDDQSINRIVNSAIQAKDFSWLRDFYLNLTTKFPQNPDYFIGVALSYANMKDFPHAMEYATKARAFGGVYESQSQKFIDCINSKSYAFNPTFSCK